LKQCVSCFETNSTYRLPAFPIANHRPTIEEYSKKRQIMLILMLMSGLFTPVSSMPEWAQAITVFNPLKYFNPKPDITNTKKITKR